MHDSIVAFRSTKVALLSRSERRQCLLATHKGASHEYPPTPKRGLVAPRVSQTLRRRDCWRRSGRLARAAQSTRPRTTRSRSPWSAAAVGAPARRPTRWRPRAPRNWSPWPTSSTSAWPAASASSRSSSPSRSTCPRNASSSAWTPTRRRSTRSAPAASCFWPRRPGFRPIHLEYAVAKGCHVFMEKSFAVDAPGIRRVLKAGEAATKKNLKIAGGLMSRHYPPLEEAVRQHPRRRDRRGDHVLGLPRARSGRLRAEVGGHERTGPSDPQLLAASRGSTAASSSTG